MTTCLGRPCVTRCRVAVPLCPQKPGSGPLRHPSEGDVASGENLPPAAVRTIPGRLTALWRRCPAGLRKDGAESLRMLTADEALSGCFQHGVG